MLRCPALNPVMKNSSVTGFPQAAHVVFMPALILAAVGSRSVLSSPPISTARVTCFKIFITQSLLSTFAAFCYRSLVLTTGGTLRLRMERHTSPIVAVMAQV